MTHWLQPMMGKNPKAANGMEARKQPSFSAEVAQ
jgi:hypothetical protein